MTYQGRSEYWKLVKLGIVVLGFVLFFVVLFYLESSITHNAKSTLLENSLYTLGGVGALFYIFYAHILTMQNMKIAVGQDSIDFIHPKMIKTVPANSIEKLIQVKYRDHINIIIVVWKDGGSVRLRGYEYMDDLCGSLEELNSEIERAIGFRNYLKYSL